MAKGCYVFNNFVDEDSNIYFVPYDKNILIDYDQENMKENQIIKLPDCTYKGINPYLGILKHKDTILLIPNHADAFILYNLESKETKRVSIPMDDIECNPWGYFSTGFIYKNDIFVVGSVYPGIVKINVDSSICENVLNLSDGVLGKSGRSFFNPVRVDDILFAVVNEDNKLIFYDMKNQNYGFINIPQMNNEKLMTLASDNKDLWMVCDNGMLINYNISSKEFNSVKLDLEKYFEEKDYIYGFIINGFMFLGSDNEAPIIKISLKELGSFDVIYKDSNNGIGFAVYGFCKNTKDELIFVDKKSLANYVIDSKNKGVSELLFPFDTKKLLSIDILSKKRTALESDVSLQDFISYYVVE